ncbi:MAG: hypothetical protein WCI55_16950 [Armatimonadota bacterium]
MNLKVNPRMAYGFALIVLSFALIGVLASMKREPNVYDAYQWNPVFEFIQKAEKVETVATTFDNLAYDTPPKDLSTFLKSKEPDGQHLVQVISSEQRSNFLTLFKKLPHDGGERAACFCPHHFVFASNGSEKLIIAICFHCSAIWVHGSKEFSSGIREVDKDNLGKAFGIDLSPHLVDAQCSFNRGSGKI